MAAIPSSLLPRLQVPAIVNPSRWASLGRRSYLPKWLPALAAAAAAPGVSLNIPSLLEDIWEGILRAVPKNKVSHSRKRHRQMAGKALKDVNNLVKCPGCGMTKRSHRLCAHCLEEMKTLWKQDAAAEKPFSA